MLRGNHPARIDDKGRLKVPNGFSAFVEQQWGSELFVTSVSGEYVRIYPMAVWLEIERKLANVPSQNPSKVRFLDHVNFFGQVVTMDRQGRGVLPQMLRETAALAGDVDFLLLQNQLAGWDKKRLQRRPFHNETFTAQDGPVRPPF